MAVAWAFPPALPLRARAPLPMGAPAHGVRPTTASTPAPATRCVPRALAQAAVALHGDSLLALTARSRKSRPLPSARGAAVHSDTAWNLVLARRQDLPLEERREVPA